MDRGKANMAQPLIIKSDRQERPSGVSVIDGPIDLATRAISGLWGTGGVI
jgi:hypothetical protein